ncbi:hypothetical protein A3J90_06105 [candidate division WOR-1 bacterium RIFOXYC2_FULL_37_10]|uniref:Uncharacterized protein n=1 Tax=candidate division WOR-1 bacterium RIFOXYB2_FULL_37_13 TaxID=1802579 RepID=A0A1F4SWA2_UNCSA|nr:MAG: hypothetical protein A2246_00885 [candidate division WOR-1 bacterium RIFOXYA2_FULL_37_7]OGC24734.1 MAG: hypothetical protein A2310_04540 [candidate division WOR-1 bacterium RIFOXYB2_FULL_37_13]OGC34806.1 MAG: hypothetical protein A3J90_06105 [candidate division WOR-1 bacterium RIFOXYC2_FULL_37_10]
MAKKKMTQDHFEIILEDINSKIDLILEKDYVSKSDLQNTEDRLMEKIDTNSLAIKANNFAIKALNNKIDEVEIRLSKRIDEVGQKIDRVETNLSDKIDEVKEILIHHMALPVH